MASDQSEAYKPKDTINRTIRTTLIATAVGAAFSGIQNTLQKQNVGAMGVFTRWGGTMASFGAMGLSYEFARNASANLRQQDDSWNQAIGGFFAGSVIGLRRRTFPAVFGYGSMIAVSVAALDYCGGKFRGYLIDPTVDEVSRKENLRKNRRRPIEETLGEIGEGRGIYGPGYEERRRQRIKENYGIDVNPVTPAH